MSYVIGIDVGTQSAKGLLMDRKGEIIEQASSAYPLSQPYPLWAEQNPDDWFNAVAEIIHELLAKVDGNDVRALCVSTLYGGAGVPVDCSITPIHPCLIWMDRRATDQVDKINQNVDTQRLFSVSGNGCDSYFGYTKMLWLKEHKPDVWQKTHYFLPPNSYINYRLTSEIAIDHSSAANIGGLYDMHNRNWSEETASLLGIPLSMMPQRLLYSGEVVGHLTNEMSTLFGLPNTLPVLAGGVDAAMSTYAAGVCGPGEHVAMIGSSMCWGFIHHEANAKNGLVSMPHVVNGHQGIYMFGGAMTAGASVSWFINNFCALDKQLAQQTGENVHARLERHASAVAPGSDGLLFLPYLMGERSPIWNAKASGSFIGLGLHHDRYNLYRAVLEGVAFSLRDNIECGRTLTTKMNDALIVVGGAAHSDLWMQIIADITGYQVLTIDGEVEAPLGDCMLAAQAAGWVQQPEEIKNWVHLVERATPNPNAQSVYEQRFIQYRHFYQQAKSTMEAL